MKRKKTTVVVALVVVLLMTVTVGGYAAVAHRRAIVRSTAQTPSLSGVAVAAAQSAADVQAEAVPVTDTTGQAAAAPVASEPETPATTPTTPKPPTPKPPVISKPPVATDPADRVPPVSRGGEDRKPLSGRVIFVDAGHGIPGSGANGANGGDEAANNLSTALMLRELLQNAGARVVMTRTTMINPTIPGRTNGQLEARTIMANESGADIFVSLHENSNQEYPNARGLTVYYRSGAASLKLAEKIDAATIAATDWYDFGTEVGTFYVLRNSTLKAAVLVECGFLSNATDERLLGTTAFRRKVATGVFNGIVAYFQ